MNRVPIRPRLPLLPVIILLLAGCQASEPSLRAAPARALPQAVRAPAPLPPVEPAAPLAKAPLPEPAAEREAAPLPPPDPRATGATTTTPEASGPAPDPDLRARALVRQFPWITRFWAELQLPEQQRAERAFRRRGDAEAGFATNWDRMGLQDRVLLLFGPGRGGASAAR